MMQSILHNNNLDSIYFMKDVNFNDIKCLQLIFDYLSLCTSIKKLNFNQQYPISYNQYCFYNLLQCIKRFISIRSNALELCSIIFPEISILNYIYIQKSNFYNSSICLIPFVEDYKSILNAGDIFTSNGEIINKDIDELLYLFSLDYKIYDELLDNHNDLIKSQLKLLCYYFDHIYQYKNESITIYLRHYKLFYTNHYKNNRPWYIIFIIWYIFKYCLQYIHSLRIYTGGYTFDYIDYQFIDHLICTVSHNNLLYFYMSGYPIQYKLKINKILIDNNNIAYNTMCKLISQMGYSKFICKYIASFIYHKNID